MIDYTIFYKRALSTTAQWGPREVWDLFVSAYAPDERIEHVFGKVNAGDKKWVLLPEYGYGPHVQHGGDVFTHQADDEAAFISAFWRTLPSIDDSCRICVDITGFVRPYLIYLVRWFQEKGIRRFDAIYSEPIRYKRRELTEFSSVVKEVRQVAGCEGSHTTDISKDVLIIGAGYEDNLISHVADTKAKATKLQLFGFPSLRADMYQESVLRARRAEESLGGPINDEVCSFFAPANDPFVTATELHRIVNDWSARRGITNLYLSPLSTKAHVLGFALFYVTECRNTATSIIFPFEERCSQSTSEGVARIWKYTIELPPT